MQHKRHSAPSTVFLLSEHSEAEVFYSSTLTLSCRLWSGNFSIFKFWLIEACTGMLVYRREHWIRILVYRSVHWLFFSFLCRFALLPFLDPEPPPSDASTASLNTTSRPWNYVINRLKRLSNSNVQLFEMIGEKYLPLQYVQSTPDSPPPQFLWGGRASLKLRVNIFTISLFLPNTANSNTHFFKLQKYLWFNTWWLRLLLLLCKTLSKLGPQLISPSSS